MDSKQSSQDHSGVNSQPTQPRIRRPRTRREWAHVALAGTAVVLCASIVPGLTHALQQRRVPLSQWQLPLPQLRQAGVAGVEWALVNVRRGETLSQLFASLGLSRDAVKLVMQSPQARAALSRLVPGQELAIATHADGRLKGLRFERDGEKIEVSVQGNTVHERVVPAQTETRTVVLSGTVGDDLRTAAKQAGLTDENFTQLTDEIFKYAIDFESDLSPKDHFSVVVDQTWKDGELVETSPVLAAAFTVGNAMYTGFRHERDGKPEYFAADGTSLKRPFIRMPIPYARLSSGFGTRVHPVLGEVKMHKGIDYAAAAGTPVMAAGDARVKFVGNGNGYGNVVELDHGGGQTTFYAHLSRFAPIHIGERIPQGTVIGYVGSTGLSTGPHLHYEFRVNGVYRNPLDVTVAPPAPLAGPALAAFRQDTERAMAKIRTVEKIIYPGMPAATEIATAPASTATPPPVQVALTPAKHRSG